MILGIGTDIVEVRRIKALMRQHPEKFRERLFTANEQAYCDKHRDKDRRYAGRWAAKEAIAKALGTGFGERLAWTDLEIVNEEGGKPTVRYSSRIAEEFNDPKLLVSLSHIEEHAVAFAIWEER